MTARLPDYAGGSIANLMSAILAAGGAAGASSPPTRLLDPAELAETRNLVLLVVDGLGEALLQRIGRGGVLHAHRRGVLTSVFPTTTAAAVSTFLTGLAPQQHAITGWFTYLRELGTVAAILPFRARGGGMALPPSAAAAVLDRPSVFSRMPRRRSIVVSHERIAESIFSRTTTRGAERIAYRDLRGCLAAVRAALASGPGRKYVYAYWPDLDSLAHVRGIGSGEVAALLLELDAAFGDFLDDIRGSGTLVLVTADHGLIDTAPQRTIALADHPRLADCLALPLCGEPRLAYCYLRPGRVQAFLDYVHEHLGHCCEPHESAAVLAAAGSARASPTPGLPSASATTCC
jgi:hypothetical protein